MKTYLSIEELEAVCRENLSNGYETAIYSDRLKCWAKFGDFATPDNLPDEIQFCKTAIWNNDNIDAVFSDYKRIDG